MATYDYLREAKDHLKNVRESLIQALLESQKGLEDKWITPEDFAEINALDTKLSALIKKYAPEYNPLSFGDLLRSMRYRVLPQYRDLWSNDPDWDGTTDMMEIKRLACEWGKTVEELMGQVEEA